MIRHQRIASAPGILTISMCLCAGCATTQYAGGKRLHEIPTYDAKTFYETTSIFGASFSPDESRVLITSDATGVYNVYAQPLSGQEPERLTDSTSNAIFAVSYFPHDRRILYTADELGNERNHIFVREVDGSVKDLTPGTDVKASFVDWSGDKTALWVLTNERDPKYFDLYKYTTDGYSKQLVFTNREGWSISDVSRDGRWVALAKVRTNADSDIYVWDSSDPDAAPKHVTPHEGDVSHSVLTFTPDSRQLYYRTNEHGEFQQAWSFVTLAPGAPSPSSGPTGTSGTSTSPRTVAIA